RTVKQPDLTTPFKQSGTQTSAARDVVFNWSQNYNMARLSRKSRQVGVSVFPSNVPFQPSNVWWSLLSVVLTRRCLTIEWSQRAAPKGGTIHFNAFCLG